MQKIALLLLTINAYCSIHLWTNGAYCTHFRLNLTESLPYTLFRTTPLHSLKRGTFVSFSHPLSTTDLVKEIAGLPGDPITIDNKHIFVNGRDCGEILKTSPSGTSLSPLAETVIPENHLYLHAPHPLSFDSRYAEFGLIHTKKIKERVCPIF